MSAPFLVLPARPQVTTFKQTCSACPSQWEGKLADGRWLYVRYRWGNLRVGIGEDWPTAIMNSSHRPIIDEDLGDDLAGVLTTEEMQLHTMLYLDWSHANQTAFDSISHD